MIKELLRLANHLDSKGLAKEADYLDSVIRKIADPLLPEYRSNAAHANFETDIETFEIYESRTVGTPQFKNDNGLVSFNIKFQPTDRWGNDHDAIMSLAWSLYRNHISSEESPPDPLLYKPSSLTLSTNVACKEGSGCVDHSKANGDFDYYHFKGSFKIIKSEGIQGD